MCLSVVLYKNKFLTSFHTKINPTLVGLPFCLIQLPFTPLCHVLSSNKKQPFKKCQPKKYAQTKFSKNLKVPFFTLTFPLPHKLLHQIEKIYAKKSKTTKNQSYFHIKHLFTEFINICQCVLTLTTINETN